MSSQVNPCPKSKFPLSGRRVGRHCTVLEFACLGGVKKHRAHSRCRLFEGFFVQTLERVLSSMLSGGGCEIGGERGFAPMECLIVSGVRVCHWGMLEGCQGCMHLEVQPSPVSASHWGILGKRWCQHAVRRSSANADVSVSFGNLGKLSVSLRGWKLSSGYRCRCATKGQCSQMTFSKIRTNAVGKIRTDWKNSVLFSTWVSN